MNASTRRAFHSSYTEGKVFSSCPRTQAEIPRPGNPSLSSSDTTIMLNASREAETYKLRHGFSGLVGCSEPIRRTLENVSTVAPTNATVLIEGETGTGKELIARAVHNLSSRHNRPFVRLNCAAIPLGLLESELFGHEKGAFTGAVARKIGRFELANHGTLFLDEVGDIPLELQAKLLRILQEQEFERLGSTQTQRVDVRLVAATHRNLRQMISHGIFRSDLYFRLNIFPISVPPLRERREDIPLLVDAFVKDSARRMSRQVKAVPIETMNLLTNYSWPGNVRELQNFIERAVILSAGEVLQAPVDTLVVDEKLKTHQDKTLAETEYEHILATLKESGWVVGGARGAARKLGLKRTTLMGKMRRLGITRSTEAEPSAPNCGPAIGARKQVLDGGDAEGRAMF